jgi:hypothetical protein
MATNNSSPLSAVLGSKIAIAMMSLSSTDRCPDIEVEGINTDGKQKKRSWYSVQLYVANKGVAKSTKKPASSVLKWEWEEDNQMCVRVC